MRPIIVGLDPGTYVGIAVFDLNMNLIFSTTITNPGKEATVAEISKHGSPIVIASDVSPPPEFVIQIASYFNARLYYPKSVIKDIDKTLDTAKYKFNSVHERDAITAVLSFFNENSNKLRWIERTLRDKGLSSIEEDVKRYALSGMRVDDAIKALVPSDDNYSKIIEYARSLPEAPKEVKEERRENRDTILGLLESNMRLRARISILEQENKSMQDKFRNAVSDQEVKNELFTKEMKIKKLKYLLKLKDKKIRHLKRILFSRSKQQGEAKSENIKQDRTGTQKQKDLKNENTNENINRDNAIGSKETRDSDRRKEESDGSVSLESIINEYRSSRYGK